MVKKYFFLIFHKLYSLKEKEEKVVKVAKVAKPELIKEPLNQNLAELDYNFLLVEFIEY